MIQIDKTNVRVDISSNTYRNAFNIENEYLNTFWFSIDDPIWDELAISIAMITNEIVKKRMKNKMNTESYKEIFESEPTKQVRK